MGRKGYKAIILFFGLLASCVKDKPTPIGNTSVPNSSHNVFIACEGRYPNNDASLYAYNSKTDSVYGDLYKSANNNPLGIVFQSMTRIGDFLYLALNGSNKVVVINATDYHYVTEIAVPVPRYILKVSASKAYVSALYHDKVYVLNTLTNSLVDSIQVPNMNTEGMCMVNNEAIICAWDTKGNHIYVVDIVTDKVVRSIKTSGYAPQEVLVDKDQLLWVLSGYQPGGIVATLDRIDPSTGNIVASFIFPSAANPMKPVFNKTKDTLYFIEVNYSSGKDNNGIYRMGIHEQALPVNALIPANTNTYFYALGINPTDGNIYVGDPLGFSQKGRLYIYHPDGALLKNYLVGYGPGHFYFD